MKSEKQKKVIIISTIAFIIFICSLIIFLVKTNETRRVFLFQSFDDKETHVEVRYLPKVDKELVIEQYVNELLHGPLHDRYRPLFPNGTRILSCFLRENTLYVDLSEEAILQQVVSSETKDAVELFKKNIKKNFRSIDEVILFMMGVEVYTQDVSVEK